MKIQLLQSKLSNDQGLDPTENFYHSMLCHRLQTLFICSLAIVIFPVERIFKNYYNKVRV